MVTYRKSKKEAWNMMVAVLSLGLALLGGIIYLAQTLRLSVPLLYGALVITVFRPWYLTHTALADGIFLCAGGSCSAVMGGDADSSGAGRRSGKVRVGKIANPYF